MTNGQQPLQHSPAETAETTMQSSTSLPIRWIDRIFARLSALYGARFADQWRGCDPAEVKSVWADCLAGYDADEIRRGLDACLCRDWPPTLPEFAKLCRPPLDYERAYIEAVEQMRRRDTGDDTWSDAAIYWAAARMGADVRAHAYPAIKSRWTVSLDAATLDIRSGRLSAIVPARRESLPPPQEPVTESDEAIRNIGALDRAFGGGRRSIYRPGESGADVEAALSRSGMSRAKFEAERLRAKGWTASDERIYQADMARCGFRADADLLAMMEASE